MAFDATPAQEVLSDRALFARDLAKHANRPYGEQFQAGKCALAKFFGGSFSYDSYPRNDWRSTFMRRYDRIALNDRDMMKPRRAPTGFDCLAILQSIP